MAVRRTDATHLGSFLAHELGVSDERSDAGPRGDHVRPVHAVRKVPVALLQQNDNDNDNDEDGDDTDTDNDKDDTGTDNDNNGKDDKDDDDTNQNACSHRWF